MNYTHIIWDWNGTLLDDVDWCISRINTMLKKRGLSALDAKTYRRIFGFPIIDYYRRAGFDFDKEPFEKLAVEYIELYHSEESNALLFQGAEEMLAAFQRQGIRQVILSASETGNLLSQMKPFGIRSYFDEILGVSDILGGGKIEAGREYILRARPERAVLIGDTVHDKEVADALGADCILIAAGHQSKETLTASGAPVVDCLADIFHCW